jgi:hypothetical protein
MRVMKGDLFDLPKERMIKSGEHLATVRRWIQHTFLNGDTVTWGSDERLDSRWLLTPRVLDELAQNIRDAVLREFGIKDNDHEYKYLVSSEGGCAFQDADTAHEIWNCLFDAAGSTVIFRRENVSETAGELHVLFHGSADEARVWILNEGKEIVNGSSDKK